MHGQVFGHCYCNALFLEGVHNFLAHLYLMRAVTFFLNTTVLFLFWFHAKRILYCTIYFHSATTVTFLKHLFISHTRQSSTSDHLSKILNSFYLHFDRCLRKKFLRLYLWNKNNISQHAAAANAHVVKKHIMIEIQSLLYFVLPRWPCLYSLGS